MTVLSVNLNKIALIRNSRNENEPHVLTFAKKSLDLGVAGITVHPRPDQRHIRYSDVPDLSNLISKYPDKELNIEGYPNKEFMDLILTICPHQVTFVPDPPNALTSSFGWDIKTHQKHLNNIINDCHTKNIRTSLFLDEAFIDFNSLIETKTDRIELYTGPYADRFPKTHNQSIEHFKNITSHCKKNNIAINAGHDLNQNNLSPLLNQIPDILEVSIGHALTCEALEHGWEHTIKQYLTILT